MKSTAFSPRATGAAPRRTGRGGGSASGPGRVRAAASRGQWACAEGAQGPHMPTGARRGREHVQTREGRRGGRAGSAVPPAGPPPRHPRGRLLPPPQPQPPPAAPPQVGARGRPASPLPASPRGGRAGCQAGAGGDRSLPARPLPTFSFAWAGSGRAAGGGAGCRKQLWWRGRRWQRPRARGGGGAGSASRPPRHAEPGTCPPCPRRPRARPLSFRRASPGGWGRRLGCPHSR